MDAVANRVRDDVSARILRGLSLLRMKYVVLLFFGNEQHVRQRWMR